MRYLVEQALENRLESLKESVIATEVFDRPADYDPQIDSVVRVDVGRLRARLAAYYEKAGPDEAVRIEIPRGKYCPLFVFRDEPQETVETASEQSAADPEPPVPSKPVRRLWLRWAASGVALAALAAAFNLWRMRSAPPPTPNTIAVLPFLNLSGDASQEYLSDGLSEELTQSLAEFNELRVVARTSAFQYKGKNADIREIGRNLRAGALLEGSISRRSGALRVVAQLIRSNDGYHLWAKTYDTSLAELPQVEIAISRAIQEALAPAAPVNHAPVSIAKEGNTTANPEAHDLYMRAAYEFNLRTVDATKRGMALAAQAVEKDPSFAQPYVAMAAGESQLNTLLAQSPHDGAQRALADVEKALAIDPSNSAAHAQKALIEYTDQWDWPKAETEFRLSLAAGSHGSAEKLYGWCLITRGRFDESRRHLQIAAELDPLSLGPQLNQVEELVAEKRPKEARMKIEQILRAAPSSPIALLLASSVALWQGDCSAAASFNKRLTDVNPTALLGRLGAMAVDYHCGHPERAAKAFEAGQRCRSRHAVPGKIGRAARAGADVASGGPCIRSDPFGSAGCRNGTPAWIDRMIFLVGGRYENRQVALGRAIL